MPEPITVFTQRYLAQRRNPASGFGYGLARRSAMAVAAAERAFAGAAPGSVDVVDFGCAEGAMLEDLATALGHRFGQGVGLDVFRSGQPPDDPARRLRFVAQDLFRAWPYPLADASADLALASAFAKHHPDLPRFLGEVARILRPGGIAVLLDPRPTVVKVGMRVGRFNPAYNPSPWSGRSIARLLGTTPLGGRLALQSFERYWLAPNHAIHRTGVEDWLPPGLRHLLGLHQCLVLRRLADDRSETA